MKTYLFTGGGTAGHVIPTKPVIQALLQRGERVAYIGSKSGLEENVLSDLDVDFFGITTGKLRRYLSFKNLIDMFRVPIGILQSIFFVFRIKPAVVFSKGGYVAFPVVFASWLLRIPVVAHESDLTPGLATKLCVPFLKLQCVNFEPTQVKASKVLVTGTPIREELRNGEASRARTWLKLTRSAPVLVVVGGSLGAEDLNQVVRQCVEILTHEFTVVHVVGRGNIDENLVNVPHYQQFEFIDQQWGDVLDLADVVISRSGANSLCELLTLRKPNLLVPLPTSRSRGDQIENAEYAQTNGWSKVIAQDQLNGDSILEAVRELFSNRQQWQEKMNDFSRLDSLSIILDALEEVSK